MIPSARPRPRGFDVMAHATRRIPAVHCLLPVMILVLLAGTCPGALAQIDPISVHCVAFDDLDGDGFLDAGESPLSGIRLTNGVVIYSTDAGGVADMVVDRAEYRYVTMTIPAGRWPTVRWYHWVPVGHAGPDTAWFGLRDEPGTATDPMRFIHICDTQVQGVGDLYDMVADMEILNEIPDRPSFLINTGDIVDIGSDLADWDHYVDQLAALEIPAFNIVGNHDTTGTTTPLNNWEDYVGPPYFSLEAGSWHFISFNDENAAVGTPRQDDWLAADIAAAPPGSKFILGKHHMTEHVPDLVDSWAAMGIQAVFSGHWHSWHIKTSPCGIVDYNAPRTRGGPLDRTARGFGIVTCEADGSIHYDFRRLDVEHFARIGSPQTGQPLQGSVLPIIVQAHDPRFVVDHLDVMVAGVGGNIPVTALTREGWSHWRADLDCDGLESGQYTVMVTGSFEDGTGINLSTVFTLDGTPAASPLPSGDWPMFRRTSDGHGVVNHPLSPPLQLAWVAPIHGRVALSSPVVADDRVFLGYRAESRHDQAGLSAFDAATGNLLWEARMSSGIALAPLVTGDVVIANTADDSIHAFDAASGTRIWSVVKPFSRYDLTAPIVSADDALVSAELWMLNLDIDSGTLNWRSDRTGSDWFPFIYSAPAVSSDHIYLGTFGAFSVNSGGFLILDRQTGDLVLSVSGAYRSPIWDSGTVFTVGGLDINNQELTARDPLGNVIWTSGRNLGRSTAAPVLSGDILVVPSWQGAIEAFDTSNGAMRWSHPVDPPLLNMMPGQQFEYIKATNSTPAIADSTVYVGSVDGMLYALDLIDGEELWSWDLATPVSSSPAVSGNMLFVGGADNHLYAFIHAFNTEVSVEPEPRRGAQLFFAHPSPNPGNDRTRLAWSLAAGSHVRLQIFDMRGRLVRTLVDGVQPAGSGHVFWNGKDGAGRRVATGTYFARIAAAGMIETREVVRIR